MAFLYFTNFITSVYVLDCVCQCVKDPMLMLMLKHMYVSSCRVFIVWVSVIKIRSSGLVAGETFH